jgi:hypothetical protein
MSCQSCYSWCTDIWIWIAASMFALQYSLLSGSSLLQTQYLRCELLWRDLRWTFSFFWPLQPLVLFQPSPDTVSTMWTTLKRLEVNIQFLLVIAGSCPVPAYSRHCIYDGNYSEETWGEHSVSSLHSFCSILSDGWGQTTGKPKTLFLRSQ